MVVCVGDESGFLRKVDAVGDCGVGETAFTLQETIPPPTSKTVFLSTNKYTGGAVGGVAGAHDKCQADANAAGLSGQYLAWISDDTFSPATDFVQSTLPYQLVTGDVIADDWADLIVAPLQHGIIYDANGDLYSGEAWAALAWTGTNTDGTKMPHNCNGWTNNTADGDTGKAVLSSNFPTFWTRSGKGACDAQRFLYCFEQ